MHYFNIQKRMENNMTVKTMANSQESNRRLNSFAPSLASSLSFTTEIKLEKNKASHILHTSFSL